MEINGVPFKEQNSATGATQSLAETFDTFLALLTTQLNNQDPLDPMESEQFTEQLVQFTGVEQAIATNDKLDQMIQLQADSQLQSAVSYIGKEAEFVSDKLLLSGGSTPISYGLDTRAEETTIAIVDSAGRTVRTIDGATGVGRHEFVWDGKDENGIGLEDGVYGFSVVSVDANGETVGTVAATTATVTGIEIVGGAASLVMGELGTATFESLFAVREAPPPATQG